MTYMMNKLVIFKDRVLLALMTLVTGKKAVIFLNKRELEM
jgi:hypothetical protein